MLNWFTNRLLVIVCEKYKLPHGRHFCSFMKHAGSTILLQCTQRQHVSLLDLSTLTNRWYSCLLVCVPATYLPQIGE